ncbi:DUF2125 domain-containing protein [Roseovarius aestuarii]|uniref:DUF2125 domain-containing protein n=1 Tax=Roseovarius aestuarii TaxID=475083 RepID=A0A1X7BSE3_9RHOB|nr:DUF2125 domain-containing protein [Roseovarius aestuarii]SMC12440.1 hypothetical protein ROA7745_02266 [Roseovarius aestuarii]
MAQWNTAATSAAAIGIFMSGSVAYADVTPEQVWNDWKDYMAGFGYEVQADESTSGDTLAVDNLTMTVAVPEEQGSMTMSLSQFSFTDNGDGTVSMSIPSQLPLLLSFDPAEGESADARIDYNTSGYSVIISGDPDDMTYNYSVAEMTIALAELVVEGTPVELGSASMTVSDIIGSSNMKIGDLRSTTQRVNSGSVAFELDVTDPEGSGRMQINGNYESIGFDGSGSFPTDMDANQMAQMLDAGFGFDGTFGFGQGGAEFSFTEDGQAVQGTSATGGGTLDVAMDAGRLSYSGEAVDYQISMAGGELPFPVEMAMKKAAFNLLMPVSSSEEEQDFAFGLTMGDFTMSDLIWGIFDPGAQLPRDPATIALDLTGKVKLLVDLMDTEAMEAAGVGETMPGELNALDLNSLTISVAGAELTGNGGFTFDNSDLETFDGVPAPTGAIDLQLVGGNGLLDKLVAMGLLPEDQAMGARMMMGLFAVPGQGDDTLTSKIEVTGDGQVSANGQRIR